MVESIARKGKWVNSRFAADCERLLVAVAVVSLLAATTAWVGVAIYQNWFEGRMADGYSYYTGERCFDCHAYGSWGIPSLTFSVACDFNGNTKTIVLTAQDTQWPIVELDTSAPEFGNVNRDGRPAEKTKKRHSCLVGMSAASCVCVCSGFWGNHVLAAAWHLQGARYRKGGLA